MSKYPGPWLAKISDLYSAWYSIKGELHLEIQNAHERYGMYSNANLLGRLKVLGPMVRMGPNKLSVNSVAALQGAFNRVHTLAAEFVTMSRDIPQGPRPKIEVIRNNASSTWSL